MASISIILRQIITVIKRFKFQELESAVMPIFPEISWNRLKSKLAKNHKTFNVTNATHVIEETLYNIHLREKDLHDRLGTLEVTDISRHNKRKIWYGYELTGVINPVSHFGKREIEGNIKEQFNKNDINVDVKTVMHDNITFVCIKEKRKAKRVQLATPIFFALFLEQRHFFCSKKNVPSSFVKAMATALGYRNSKEIKLMGKDLRSLIRFLWIKQQGVLCTANIGQPPVFVPSAPVVTNIGIDFTQSKQRKSYIEQCLGKDPPTFELLVIKASDTSIKHDGLAAKLPNENMHMNWEFRSRNIPKFLSSLVEKRVFTLPLPKYVSNLMTFGKNELKLQIDSPDRNV